MKEHGQLVAFDADAAKRSPTQLFVPPKLLNERLAVQGFLNAFPADD